MGTAVNDINKIVDRTLASLISIGGISALNYAQRINGFVQGIVVVSIATAMYPLISKMAADDNILGLKKTLSESVIAMSMLVIPATIGAMLFATPIVEILFGRGAFDSQAVSMTSSALFFYAIGMTGIGLRQILSRFFYALQDTKTPMINASVGIVVNIVLNIVLSRYFGIPGLALATSISATLTSCLLLISLRRKIGPFGLRGITVSFAKIVSASAVMGLLSRMSYHTFTNFISGPLAFLLAVFVGAISYLFLIYLFRIDEVDLVIQVLKNKLRNGSNDTKRQM